MKKPMKMKKKSAMKLETERKLKKTVKRGFIEGASETKPKRRTVKAGKTEYIPKDVMMIEREKEQRKRSAAMKMKKKSAMKKTTYMLKKGGKKVKVSKAEYEKVLGGKAGSKLNK